jgi:hypothetical protein
MHTIQRVEQRMYFSRTRRPQSLKHISVFILSSYWLGLTCANDFDRYVVSPYVIS